MTKNILIYSDKTETALELVTAAKEIGGTAYAVCINQEEQSAALSSCGINAVKINLQEINCADTFVMAAVLSQVATHIEASIVLLSSEKSSKHLAGRLAERLQAACLTGIEAIKVQGEEIECTRNMLGGATVAVQLAKTPVQVLALNPKVFPPASPAPGGSINDFTVEAPPSTVRLLETKEKIIDSVDIVAAETLVIVGQGVDDHSLLAVIENLAQKINGTVACTKPVATDKKWLPEARIVGISGKTCKPHLALLLGISGQVQFYVGIRDAKTLIAIDQDENAPICSLVDYTLLAKVEDVVPKLQGLL